MTQIPIDIYNLGLIDEITIRPVQQLGRNDRDCFQLISPARETRADGTERALHCSWTPIAFDSAASGGDFSLK